MSARPPEVSIGDGYCGGWDSHMRLCSHCRIESQGPLIAHHITSHVPLQKRCHATTSALLRRWFWLVSRFGRKSLDRTHRW